MPEGDPGLQYVGELVLEICPVAPLLPPPFPVVVLVLVVVVIVVIIIVVIVVIVIVVNVGDDGVVDYAEHGDEERADEAEEVEEVERVRPAILIRSRLLTLETGEAAPQTVMRKMEASSFWEYYLPAVFPLLIQNKSPWARGPRPQ